jgi:hypothetical protein
MDSLLDSVKDDSMDDSEFELDVDRGMGGGIGVPRMAASSRSRAWLRSSRSRPRDAWTLTSCWR